MSKSKNPNKMTFNSECGLVSIRATAEHNTEEKPYKRLELIVTMHDNNDTIYLNDVDNIEALIKQLERALVWGKLKGAESDPNED